MRGNKHFLFLLYNGSDILLHFLNDIQVPDGCLLLLNLNQDDAQEKLDKDFYQAEDNCV
jgi:hypothetical protein